MLKLRLKDKHMENFTESTINIILLLCILGVMFFILKSKKG